MADNRVSFGGRNVGSYGVAADVTLVDNHKKVLGQMSANVTRALEALGTEAVGMIVKQMQTGYEKPVRDTGSLMRDVQYHVSINNKEVAVGNTLDYGPYVHEGTRKMAKREYITDALVNPANKQRLQAVASEYLAEGFVK